MITNFKIFERIEELKNEEFKIEKFSYWIIYGSQSDCVKILNKLRYQYQLYDKECNLYTIIEKMEKNIRDNKYPDTIVTILTFLNESFHYGPVKDNIEKKFDYKITIIRL